MITKANIGLAISRNFNKVTIDFLDEPIEHENDEDLVAGIKKRFKLIRAEIEAEFKEMQR